MTKIIYRIGDATAPIANGQKVIAHICNNVGAWGAGFVMALSRKWDGPEKMYRLIPKDKLKLGTLLYVRVEEDIVVANMIAQDDIISRTKSTNKKSPIRYDALVDNLITLNEHCINTNSTLHLPRIGAGLAGGNWSAISALIEEHITVPVYVYDLKPEEGVEYLTPSVFPGAIEIKKENQ